MRYCHAHPTPDLYVLVVLAIETAMRQGELLKLEWEHISLQRRIAHLPDTKNGSKRGARRIRKKSYANSSSVPATPDCSLLTGQSVSRVKR